MGHLVLLVLAEAKPLAVHADRLEELLGEPHEIGEHLIADDALLHRLADRDLELPAVVGQQAKRLVGDVLVARPGLVLGIDEQLALHHVELPQADDALARRDLIAIAAADLDDAQRKLLPVVPVQVGEVDEYALGGLRAHVADPARTGADDGLEHKVELFHRGQLALARWTYDVVLADELIDLLLAERAGVRVQLAHQMVGAVRLLACLALHHLVGELVDMAGRLEHDLRTDGLRVDLDEAFAKRVQPPPDLDDVVLQGGA